ncbi:MAG: hypothetical protein NZ807_10275 [Dehalococcoidia bacterium]|nr:hypothetical protein [Dehalococcoidia bacterium]
MSDEKVLTKEIAEQLLANPFKMSEYTAIEDVAAESLNKHKIYLHLNGLTSLSDAAAEGLGNHEGHLELNGICELSSAAAKGLSRHFGCIDLMKLTHLPNTPGHIALAEQLRKSHQHEHLYLCVVEVSDECAMQLSKHQGGHLHLPRLTRLSESPGHVALAQRLSRNEEDDMVSHDMDTLEVISDGAAQALSESLNLVSLEGLTELNDSDGHVALVRKMMSMRSQYQHDIIFPNLKSLSNTIATELSKFEGDLEITLDNLPASAAQILRDAGHGV